MSIKWNPGAVDIDGLVAAANTHVALCRQCFSVSHRLGEQLKAAFWEGARWYRKAHSAPPPEKRDRLIAAVKHWQSKKFAADAASPYDNANEIRELNAAESWLLSIDLLAALGSLPQQEKVENLKLRTASESVGWLNSEGPLTTAPEVGDQGAFEAWPRIAELANELAEVKKEREQAVQDVGRAMWLALDIVREHIGSFQNWPEELKLAFSEAIIDKRPMTKAEIAHGQELAKRFGWETRFGHGVTQPDASSVNPAVISNPSVPNGEDSGRSAALGSLPVPAPQEGLEALIAQWRTMRRAAADVGLAYAGKKRGYEAAGVCEALERCADELAALLPSRASTETTQKHEEKNNDDESRVDKWGLLQSDLPRRKKG